MKSWEAGDRWSHTQAVEQQADAIGTWLSVSKTGSTEQLRERERDAETSRERWSEEDTSGDCRMERRVKKKYLCTGKQRQCYEGK